MKYVFGPVPSRRLGQSLGIDTIPLKTCNWNCVYCQLGRTRPVVNDRRNYFPAADILAEIRQALSAHEPGQIDWVTFVGSGEPTLHASLGQLIREVKTLSDLPVAVITNGALLYEPLVRQELAAADAVLPSLDAGTADLFRCINRPHPTITFERLLSGLSAFRQEYTGKLWIEVMLVSGLNDTKLALHRIAELLRPIAPDEIHISLPTRPPVETWVQPPDEERIQRAITIFGTIARVLNPTEGSFDLGSEDSIVESVLGIISRHPMRQEELEVALGQWAPDKVNKVLATLESSVQAQVVKRNGVRYWTAAQAAFPQENQSTRADPHRRHSIRK
jgi:wyosine [tRNA(Phe)-imidazoG37] synthetase (radical SAM superfamily)